MIGELMTMFHGTTIQTLTWNERPCWVARHIGESIGYADGGRMVDLIRGEWASEFVEGLDYEMMTGEPLAELKRLDMIPRATGDHQSTLPVRSARAMVLFETGIHMALMKTHMPLGVGLRRHLSSNVLPQILRTGSYAPTPPPDNLKEIRLAAREMRLSGDKAGSVVLLRAHLGMPSLPDPVPRASTSIGVDPWTGPVLAYAEGREAVRVSEVLDHLQITADRRSRVDELRVGVILRDAGWHSKKSTWRGVRANWWTRL